jgi:hypothetical protein
MARQQGTALIQAAGVLPVITVLVFGVFEFSWAICQQHLILTGISDAALYCQSTIPATQPSKVAKIRQPQGLSMVTRRVEAGRWTMSIFPTFIDIPAGDNGLTNQGAPIVA